MAGRRPARSRASQGPIAVISPDSPDPSGSSEQAWGKPGAVARPEGKGVRPQRKRFVFVMPSRILRREDLVGSVRFRLYGVAGYTIKTEARAMDAGIGRTLRSSACS